MRVWTERPMEIAHLLNPGFTGEILRRAAIWYTREARAPFPFPLAFLILPVLLHESTRDSMPPTTRKTMHDWLSENPQVRIGFADRTRELLPITREAVCFLMQLGELVFVEVEAGKGMRASRSVAGGLEGAVEAALDNYFRKARHLGIWFARAGDAANVYTMWGVRP
jgi:hypothetical protein